MTLSVHRAATAHCRLGETPLWDDRAGCLTWIDIERPTCFALDTSGGKMTETARAGTYLGCQALMQSGRLLLARDQTLLLCADAGDEGSELARIEAEDGLDTRLNDGRVDAWGHLWIGTMDNALERPLGALYRVDPDGSVRTAFGGVIVSNSIAFSPDGRWLSFSDTRTHLTWKLELDPHTGMPARRTVLMDWRRERDRPDGACFDVDGCLWIAMFGGGGVVRLTPSGDLDREIELPVTNPTCCAFGGSDMRTLFVTTARKFLSTSALSAEPLAGSLLAIDGAGEGLPENRFRA